MMKLVFLKQGDVSERSWLEYLLRDVISESVVQEPWPVPQPNTIYSLSSNMLPLVSIPRTFLAEVERTKAVGLVHTSDEWLGGDCGIYRSFHFVIRNYWKDSLRKQIGVLTIPLGLPGGLVTPDQRLPASTRTNAWMFFGRVIASRAQALRAFASVPRGVQSNGQRITPAEFYKIMGDTIFVPAPMGNLVAETWRFYEALELGCIPIVERRFTLDYYRTLLGSHPVPTFPHWKSAADFVNQMLSDPQGLDAMQQEVSQWWQDKKQALTADVSVFVKNGVAGRFRPALQSPSVPPRPVRLANQYLELSRHQSLASILLLARKAMHRGSMKLPY